MLLQELNEDESLLIAILCLCNVILKLYTSFLVTHDMFNCLVRSSSGCSGYEDLQGLFYLQSYFPWMLILQVKVGVDHYWGKNESLFPLISFHAL